MRLLLDTHVLLWSIAEPERIPALFRKRIESPDNDIFFSAASIWELAIKMRVGRITLPVTLDDIAGAALRMGFVELPVTAAHAVGIARLPLHHRDPFDRLLLAQAQYEPVRLLTVDRALRQYSGLVEIIA